jgi:hypothetical protein
MKNFEIQTAYRSENWIVLCVSFFLRCVWAFVQGTRPLVLKKGKMWNEISASDEIQLKWTSNLLWDDLGRWFRASDLRTPWRVMLIVYTAGSLSVVLFVWTDMPLIFVRMPHLTSRPWPRACWSGKPLNCGIFVKVIDQSLKSQFDHFIAYHNAV